MSRTLMVFCFLVGICYVDPARAQDEQNLQPWWFGLEFGVGQLGLTAAQSDIVDLQPNLPPEQFPKNRRTFAAGLFGGHRLGKQARIGLEVNGWLLEAGNLNDPSRGEGVSNASAIVDVFPVRKLPFFVRAGAGAASYQDNHELGFGGIGWAWTVCGGYEFRLSRSIGLAPIVGYASGNFGDVHDILAVETGRRYSVVEFKVAVIFHVGKTHGKAQ